MTSRIDIAAAWLDTRLAMRLDPDAMARRRKRLWTEMRPALSNTPALRKHADSALRDIPITTPSTMRGDIAAWNSCGITATEATSAAMHAEAGGDGVIRDGIAAGLSTGTSGERGVFLASMGERARYVGQSVARILPLHAPVTGGRIALVLRADSELYRDAGGGRFSFLHVPLGLDPQDMADRLRAFRPTVLIAPPRELSSLARIGVDLPSLRRLLWGSEPMASQEREWIRSTLGVRPDPIYQATEGFIAAPCRHGALHLNDDSMDIELEAVAGVDAARPVVTDLRRHVQPMVRVRMDDLIRLAPRPCRCGFAGRVVEPVSGRVQDIWRTPTGPMLPDQVDDRMTEALGAAARWKVSGSPEHVTVTVNDGHLVDAAAKAVGSMMGEIPASVAIGPDSDGPKRRRVTWREKQ